MLEPSSKVERSVAEAPRRARMLEHRAHRRCFAVLGTLALAASGTAIAGGLGVGSTLALGSLGVLTWTLVEYVLHRFAFHLPRSHPLSVLGARQHLDHHDAPSRQPISKPLQLTVPAIVLGVAALWQLGGAAGLAVGGGLVAGYLGYELLHVAAHVLVRDHPLPALQRWHLEHHRDARHGFGITSPLWDVVLRTRHRRRPPS
ncbi:MAG: sterol desaturase family protein [Deltaproteobacteria bacterium]|nr:sterol desaturase family protein [Nannocystaceae bacterium]